MAEKIIFTVNDLQADVKQNITEEVKVCSIDFKNDRITFHRAVDFDTLKQLYYNYDDISRTVSKGMGPVDDGYDIPTYGEKHG